MNVSNQMFKKWLFGTVNIRSGKEKDEGAKLYLVAKEVARADLSICCLQEVKYRNSGHRIIELDTGEKFEFIWCGMKKRRTAGVGFLIRVSDDIIFQDPDILNPRVIAMNIKVHRFNLRFVNAYSPTDTDCSESTKDDFYKLLKKACIKNEKHQKLIVAGDFNAKTSLAMKKCFYDGTNVVQDDDCNANGTRLKDFCRNNKLCISSTYFDYPNEMRYTWYSCDGRTKRVNDYVLTEKFVQAFVTDCKSEPDRDFDSDHRVLVTSLNTPTTRKARRKPKQVIAKRKPNIAALNDYNTQKSFQKSIEDMMKGNNMQLASPTDISSNLINVLTQAVVIKGRLRRNDPHFG